MIKRGREKKHINLGLIILIIVSAFVVLMFVSCTLYIFAGEAPMPSGNVALINIRGTITVEGGAGFGRQDTSSEKVVKYIKTADKEDSIKAILLDINSGGGSVVASKEIVDAVKRAEKPCYAVIREIGTSGAYWIASGCDNIIANELSITGSIGAIASYLEFSGLLQRYNISYQRIVSGPYKDIGSPFKNLTFDERAIFEEKLAKIHEYFVADVAANRNISINKAMEIIATGEFYLGSEALELGLVDILGDMDTAAEMIKRDLNLTKIDFAEYKKSRTFLDMLIGAFSEQFFFIGRGIGDALVSSMAVSRIDIIA